MDYGEGRYWITYNGEIYNYKSLRDELRRQGFSFRTESDTEVILAGYARWGTEVFARLRGIFALAIWDRGSSELVLARDHLGVKPLMYHCSAAGITFGSGLRAIVLAGNLPISFDQEALADYLELGYVMSPRTILLGVRKLPAGSWLRCKDGHVQIAKYWDLAQMDLSPIYLPSQSDYSAAFDARLFEAVRLQLVSDVPVGAFLSGGLDSSTVVYHIRREFGPSLKTFSFGFKERSYSELEHAERVNRFLGTEHYSDKVAPPDLPRLVDEVVVASEEPLGDSSLLPTFLLSRLARRHVKVALSGDGADEILAGYDTYLADAAHRIYARLPSVLRRGVARTIARRVAVSRSKASLSYGVRQFLLQGHHDSERAHYGWRLLFDETERYALLGNGTNGYRPFETYEAYYRQVPELDPLTQALYVDINTWLVDDILVKVDRASMAMGLEVRVPFLDPELVQFSMCLPPSQKLRGTSRKFVLRRAMRRKLPTSVLRRRKQGFNAPVSDWLQVELREIMEAHLHRPSNLVDTDHPIVRNLWSGHLRGSGDSGFKLWSLLLLLRWERIFGETLASHEREQR